jgi:hypothetical protein
MLTWFQYHPYANDAGTKKASLSTGIKRRHFFSTIAYYQAKHKKNKGFRGIKRQIIWLTVMLFVIPF